MDVTVWDAVQRIDFPSVVIVTLPASRKGRTPVRGGWHVWPPCHPLRETGGRSAIERLVRSLVARAARETRVGEGVGG